MQKLGRRFAAAQQEFTTIEQNLDYWELHEKKSWFRDSLRRLVENNVVIEIGAGNSPQRILFEFNPLRYICVEASARKPDRSGLPEFVTYENGIDGLTYLSRLKDDSVVVVSSGLFDHKILIDEEYRRRLVATIFRKTKRMSLTLHTISDGFESLFLMSGFRLCFGYNFGQEITEAEVDAGFTQGGMHGMVPMFFFKLGTPMDLKNGIIEHN